MNPFILCSIVLGRYKYHDSLTCKKSYPNYQLTMI